MKKHLIRLLKIAIPLAILTWLVVDVQRNDPQTFQQLRTRPKQWTLLAAGLGMALGAQCCAFVRWYLLVRALHIQFRLRDAFRLGFLGYLFNFVSLGHVGGDLFKAVFVAREHPGRRTEVVSSVLVDRVIGFFGLLLVTCVALSLIAGDGLSPEAAVIARSTYILTALGALGMLLVLLPGFTRGSLVELLTGLPKVGPTCERLIGALRMYRRHKPTLIASVLLGIGVHIFNAVAIFLGAAGLFETVPSLGEHLVIGPVASVAGALPIAPAGLGTFEFAMDYLYDQIPQSGTGQGQGLVVALCFRVMMIGIAFIGVVYYWMDRREVRAVLHQAESEAEGREPAGEDATSLDVAAGPNAEAAALELQPQTETV